MELLKKTKDYIKEYQLIEPGELVLVAVSAGRDSMTLAHLLLRLQKELDFNLAIANFNHHLRPEADEEGEFVAEFARINGVPVFLGGADIAQLSVGGNLQEIARRERYTYLRSLAAKIGAQKIAVAHHADDQAETVLLHLLRGSGLSGLAAMSPIKNNIIRPLLFASRRDICAYIAENKLEYREDSSNACTKYLRNKIRLELIPLLRDYNPNITEALIATADICRQDDQVLEDLAENALAEAWINDDNALERTAFNELPVALQRRVIRKAYTLIMGESRELNFDQVEAILRLKEEQCTVLPGGLKAYRRGNIYFAADKPPLPQYLESYPLQIDGQWHAIDNWGWEYQAQVIGDTLPVIGMFSFILPLEIANKAIWRTRREGDFVASSGKSGKYKIKDMFIDNRVPVYQRSSWPILVADEELLWVCGLWQKDLEHTDTSILIKVKKYDKI